MQNICNNNNLVQSYYYYYYEYFYCYYAHNCIHTNLFCKIKNWNIFAIIINEYEYTIILMQNYMAKYVLLLLLIILWCSYVIIIIYTIIFIEICFAK